MWSWWGVSYWFTDIPLNFTKVSPKISNLPFILSGKKKKGIVFFIYRKTRDISLSDEAILLLQIEFIILSKWIKIECHLLNVTFLYLTLYIKGSFQKKERKSESLGWKPTWRRRNTGIKKIPFGFHKIPFKCDSLVEIKYFSVTKIQFWLKIYKAIWRKDTP